MSLIYSVCGCGFYVCCLYDDHVYFNKREMTLEMSLFYNYSFALRRKNLGETKPREGGKVQNCCWALTVPSTSFGELPFVTDSLVISLYEFLSPKQPL